MYFKVGHFYTHEGGRQIAVLAEVKSFRWGQMMLIEEADKTGHSISCMDINEKTNMTNQGWTEIGKEEWMINFTEQSCSLCGEVFQSGEKFVATNDGPVHFKCYSAIIREKGANIVEPIQIH